MSKEIATKTEKACREVRLEALKNYKPIQELIKRRSNYKKGSKNWRETQDYINVLMEAHKIFIDATIKLTADKYEIKLSGLTNVLGRIWNGESEKMLLEY